MREASNKVILQAQAQALANRGRGRRWPAIREGRESCTKTTCRVLQLCLSIGRYECLLVEDALFLAAVRRFSSSQFNSSGRIFLYGLESGVTAASETTKNS